MRRPKIFCSGFFLALVVYALCVAMRFLFVAWDPEPRLYFIPPMIILWFGGILVLFLPVGGLLALATGYSPVKDQASGEYVHDHTPGSSFISRSIGAGLVVGGLIWALLAFRFDVLP